MKRICLLAVLGVPVLGCDLVTTLPGRPPVSIVADDHLSISVSPRDAPLPGQPSRVAPRTP
jgi:hypothetical protein